MNFSPHMGTGCERSSGCYGFDARQWWRISWSLCWAQRIWNRIMNRKGCSKSEAKRRHYIQGVAAVRDPALGVADHESREQPVSWQIGDPVRAGTGAHPGGGGRCSSIETPISLSYRPTCLRSGTTTLSPREWWESLGTCATSLGPI